MKRLFAFPGFEIHKDATVTAPNAIFPFPRVEFDGPADSRVRVHVQEGDKIALVGFCVANSRIWRFVGTLSVANGLDCLGIELAPGYAQALDRMFVDFIAGTAQPANLVFLAADFKDEKPPVASAKKALKVQPRTVSGTPPSAPVAAVGKSRELARG